MGGCVVLHAQYMVWTPSTMCKHNEVSLQHELGSRMALVGCAIQRNLQPPPDIWGLILGLAPSR